MTDTANLGLPFIEAGQAQKHVTHNEALRILDAAIQIAVQDVTRAAPPASPSDGQRHIVASSPTGAWTGRAKAIATWQDGAWAFLIPKNGWCVWSIADAGLLVFDGTLWRDTRGLGFDNLVRLGVNTAASAPNLLSVKSNAALFAAINTADGGSGDVRVQLSKESAAKTASIYFADAYSGRAEFGLVGSDAFKLKVSADGSSWMDALGIDQTTGLLTLPRGVALSGVIAPPQITANQNDYAPTGLAAASVVQLSGDAARSLSGLTGGAEGRVVSLINVGANALTLLDESASSAAANRFALGSAISMSAKQAVVLRYDGTTSRWHALARPSVAATSGGSASSPPQGRLTLQSAVPVMTTTQSGKATLYYTPACGNQIPLYDGTSLVSATFSELSASTTDTTKSPAAIGGGKVNDWFVWNDGGTLRLSHGPDWTSDTTRSGGTALTRVNGVLLNTIAITNGPAALRGTYVGTTRSNASSLFDWIFGGLAAGGRAGFFGVWNTYNRSPVATMVSDSTDIWTYGVADTWRAANNSASMRVSAVRGLDEDGISATYSAIVVAATATNAYAGIGLNATTTYSGVTGFNGNTFSTPVPASYAGLMGLGFNYISAIEANTSNSASTWIGDSGASNFLQTGLSVSLWQ